MEYYVVIKKYEGALEFKIPECFEMKEVWQGKWWVLDVPTYTMKCMYVYSVIPGQTTHGEREEAINQDCISEGELEQDMGK